MDNVSKWLKEHTTWAGFIWLVGVLFDTIHSGTFNANSGWATFVGSLLLVLKGRNVFSKFLGSTPPSVPLVLGLLAVMLSASGLVGCAQNLHPEPKMVQTNEGPSTPQDQTINVNPVIVIDSSGGMGTPEVHPVSSTTRPAVTHYEVTRPQVYASAASGRAWSGGGAGININIPVWVDASSKARGSAGAMSPSTGAQDAQTSGEQRPETQVNPSLAFGMPGSAVTSSATGTAAYDKGTATGAPNTVSPNQQPTTLNMKVPAGVYQQMQDFLGALLGRQTPAVATPATSQPG